MIDPVTLIVSALTAGATAALQETAGTAVKDAYQGLAGLVRKKFGGDEKAKASLADPRKIKSRKKVLEKSIIQKGLGQDKDILKQAKKLQKLLSASGFTQNSIVNLKGNVNGFVNENKGSVVMNFTSPPKKQSKNKNTSRG